MTVRVGINGFGRIGRQSLKALIERTPEVEVVAVNDLVDTPDQRTAVQARLDLRRVCRQRVPHGRLPGHRRPRDQGPPGHATRPSCPGRTWAWTWCWSRRACSPMRKAAAHLEAGARKVIISAPAKGEDITIVLGVNEDKYDPAAHHIISNASCTTNCLAPAAKVVHDNWTIKRGLMNTIHSYTNDQRILDVAHKDPRRARAAGLNIIPTTHRRGQGAGARASPTSRASSTASACACPTPTVSVVDFTAELERPATAEELNAAFRAAAAGPLKGILGVSRRAARVHRLPGRRPLLDHRRGVHDVPRRHLREGHLLVRQRVGLQLPRRRPAWATSPPG